MSKISLQLKRLRGEAELSQHQLANQSGVSVGFISKLEAGQYRTVSLDKCQQLAKGLGLTLKDFLTSLGFLEDAGTSNAQLDLQNALRGNGFTTSQAKEITSYAGFIKYRSDQHHQPKSSLNSLADINAKEKKALLQLKRELKKAFGRQIISIRLFGSQARGQTRKYSDVDVLVVMTDRNWPTRRAVHAIAGDISRQTGVDLSLKIITPALQDRLRHSGSPFIANIDKEGIGI